MQRTGSTVAELEVWTSPHLSRKRTAMQSAITRLALFQFLVVFYCIVAVGTVLKVRFGSPAPQIFATHLRDYGFLLLLLPAAWLIWASIYAHRPRVGTGDLTPILFTGFTLLGALIFLAIVGTVSAARAGTIVQVIPAQRPTATNPQ